jgi:glycerophosphoryl diester phosphodiesterase
MSRKKGFRYVECDVLFTSDEVPVILHDATINRTARNANGTAISATTRIDSITFAQARTYDFGIWKNSKYAGTLIPSFAEFIQLCKQLSITPVIELKTEQTWTDERVDSVAYWIKAVGMQNHVAFISFSKTALAKMSAHFPRAMLGLGYENTYDSTNISALATDAADLKNGENTVCVSVRNSSMTSALFEILESNGISSFVWTVNSERDCVNLHRNVIGVLSDSLNAGKIIEDGLINS